MDSYLPSVIKQFCYYKSLGDKTLEQLTIDELQRTVETDSNSITIIVKHMVGNMLSRWTNFLSEDGEKDWRHRDQEFVESYTKKSEVISEWNKGWKCLFKILDQLTDQDLHHIIYIRNQGHTVTEAINRQMMHYAYHVGQIVFIGKIIKGNQWNSLSIPKGKSKDYNNDKFAKDKGQRHFTEDL